MGYARSWRISRLASRRRRWALGRVAANVVLSPAPGVLTLTGPAPTVLTPVTLSPSPGQLLLTGPAPTILLPVAVAPAPGQLVLTGPAPNVLTPVILAPDPGQLVLTGPAPGVFVSDHQVVVPDPGQLLLSGPAPNVLVSDNVVVQPDPGVLLLSGPAPSILTPVLVQPDPGVLLLTGPAPDVSVTANQVVSPDPGVLVLTGPAPNVTVGDEVRVHPDPGVLVLTGPAPNVLTPVVVSPEPAVLLLTGPAPDVRVGIQLSPAPGVLTLTGPAPAVLTPVLLAPPPAVLLLTGPAPDVIVAPGSPVVSPAPAVLTLTGPAPNVVVSGGGDVPRFPRYSSGRPIWTRVYVHVFDIEVAVPVEARLILDARPVTLPPATKVVVRLPRLLVERAEPEPIPDPLAEPPEDFLLDVDFSGIIWDYTYQWANEVGLSTWNQINEAVLETREEGGSADDLLDLLQGLFSRSRARTIAVTETTRLLGLGAQASYRQRGVEEWSWQNVNDPWVCDDRPGNWRKTCRELQDNRFPMQIAFQPNHPNCRCFPRPIIPAHPLVEPMPVGSGQTVFPDLASAAKAAARRHRRFRFKHLPGQHPQQSHAGEGGGSGPAPRAPARTFTSDEGYAWHASEPVQAWLAGTSEADRDTITGYAGFGYGPMNDMLRGRVEGNERFTKLQRRDATEAETEAFRKHIRETPGEPFRLPGGGRIDMLGRTVEETVPDTERIATVRGQVERLNEAIRERGMVIPEDMEVGRGAYVPGLTRDDLEASVGGVISEPGFSSTMVGDANGRLPGYPAAARNEYEYRNPGASEGIAMIQRIRVPAGARAVPVEAVRQQEQWSNSEGYQGESELLLPAGARFRVTGVRDAPDDYEGRPQVEVDLEYLP